jgi:hypothetical protein
MASTITTKPPRTTWTCLPYLAFAFVSCEMGCLEFSDYFWYLTWCCESGCAVQTSTLTVGARHWQQRYAQSHSCTVWCEFLWGWNVMACYLVNDDMELWRNERRQVFCGKMELETYVCVKGSVGEHHVWMLWTRRRLIAVAYTFQNALGVRTVGEIQEWNTSGFGLWSW